MSDSGTPVGSRGRAPGLWLAAALVPGLLLLGCDPAEEGKKAGKHEHRAPHGGTLVEFGEEFAHLELVLDPAIGRLTGYLLDGEAEGALRLEQAEIRIRVQGSPPVPDVVLKALGNPLTGETPGDSSQFEGQSDALKGRASFDGAVVKVRVKGRDFGDVAFAFPMGNEEK